MRMFCGPTTALAAVTAAENGVTAAPPAGEAVTFWNWPPKMRAGANVTFETPLNVTAVVTTKDRRRLEPYAWRFCGLTAKTPAIVNVSPCWSVTFCVVVKLKVEVDAQPVARP